MKSRDGASIQLQPRDIDLLQGLFESRVMTLSHVSALYFGNKSEMAKKRVQKLKAAGLLRDRPRHASDPSVLFLGRKAFQILQDEGRLSNYPEVGLAALDKRAQVSPLTLRHELAVMDVKVAMVSAIAKTDRFMVAEFSTWPILYEFRACKPNGERVTIRPDGFIRIHEKEDDGGLSEHTFFLEVDRSTKSLDSLCQTCHCYMDYYRSGGFAVRNGKTRQDFKMFPFRVLLICNTTDRLNNIARRLVQNHPPIGTQVWLTTMKEAALNMLSAIWTQPKDYYNSTVESALKSVKESICPDPSSVHDVEL